MLTNGVTAAAQLSIASMMDWAGSYFNSIG